MNVLSPKNPGFPLLLGTAVAVPVFFVACLLQWTSGATYFPWSNYISDLSAMAAGGSVLYVVMMVTLAVSMGWFYATSASHLKAKLGRTGLVGPARTLGLLGSASIIVMVFFPLDPAAPATYAIHMWCAYVLFACITGYSVLYGLVFMTGSGALRTAGIIGLVNGAFSGAFLLLVILAELLKVLPKLPIMFLIQWSFFSLAIFWFIFAGVGMADLGDA